MKHRNLTAIILKKREVFEQDLSLTLLDENGQRLEVMVKGAGTGKSQRRRHLEVMNLIKASLYEGKNHHYLQDVQCQQSFATLKDDLDRILQASLLLELTELSVLADDPHPEIYELLLATFSELNNKNVQTHLLDMCLVQLAHHLGFLPSFRTCSQCHEEKLNEDLHWDRTQGTLRCERCHPAHTPLEMKYRKAMEFFRQNHVSQSTTLRLNEEEQGVLRQLTYQLFEVHLNRPLKTLSLP